MRYKSGMSIPTRIIEAVGTRRIAARVGVVETAVINAKRKPLLPGRWYAPVKELCDEDGIDCPIEAFNWSRAENEAGAA